MCAVQYRINTLVEYTLLSRLKDVNSADQNLLTSHKSTDNNIINNYKNNFCAEQFILKKALNVNAKILLASSSVLSVIRASK